MVRAWCEGGWGEAGDGKWEVQEDDVKGGGEGNMM